MKISVHFETLDEFMAFLNGTPPKTDEQQKHHLVRGNQSLNVRAENCLRSAGIEYMEDAQRLGMSGLLKLPNVGRLTAKHIMSWTPSE